MSLSVKIKKQLGKFTLDVDFETAKGVMGLLGASGCGKSLTLRCIAGVLRPDSGQVILNGKTLFDSEKGINLPPQKRGVGLLFQHYALFPNMTTQQNISAVLALYDPREIEARFQSLADRFRLVGLEKLYPSQLSGGQQQRVALARMMASAPSAILLDEPLSALDSYLRWQLEWELSDLFMAYEGPVLYVSHNRGEVARLCQTVCAVSGGRSEQVRPTEDFFSSPQTLASALLAGCKSYSKAVIHQDSLFAVDWNIPFPLPERLPKGVTAVALRDGRCALGEVDEPLCIVCTVLGVMQSPQHATLRLLPQGADRKNPRSHMIVTTSRAYATLQEGMRIGLFVPEEALIMLFDENALAYYGTE